ncbi:2-thiouracil desulfurase family protein, partial [Yersinia enterocolitica]
MEPKPARVLISACLMGKPVRYNGSALSVHHEIIQRWQDEGRLVMVCPELAAGMPV